MISPGGRLSGGLQIYSFKYINKEEIAGALRSEINAWNQPNYLQQTSDISLKYNMIFAYSSGPPDLQRKFKYKTMIILDPSVAYRNWFPFFNLKSDFKSS